MARTPTTPDDGALDPLDPGDAALRRADTLGRRAAAVGFDWPDISGVLAKLDEERAEVAAAMASGRIERVEAEIGDLLFSVVNLCRHVGVDPEAALARTNREFERRFRAVEAGVRADGLRMHEATLDDLEARWQAAKRTAGVS